MSKYTIELGSVLHILIEEDHPEIKSCDYKNIIKYGNEKLFDFNFPIFDEEYRSILETKISKHYFQREIGTETIGQFKLKLDEKLNLIMPFYNSLYNQKLESIDLMNTTDITTDHELKKTGDVTNKLEEGTETGTETAGSTKSVNKYSDAPMGNLTNIENASYLTDVNIVDGTDSAESNTTSIKDSTNKQTLNTIDKYLEHRFGREGLNPVEQLFKIKDLFFSIDLMILKELEELFILLW